MNLFEIVKYGVSCREAAERYGVEVNHYGMALCPFHNDRYPSLYVADDATTPAGAAVIVCAGRSCFRFGNSLRPARTNLPPAALFAAMPRSSASGQFLFCERETEKERTR